MWWSGNFLADRPNLRRKAVASKIMEGKKTKGEHSTGFSPSPYLILFQQVAKRGKVVNVKMENTRRAHTRERRGIFLIF